MKIPTRFKVIFAVFLVALVYGLIVRPYDKDSKEKAEAPAAATTADTDTTSCSAGDFTVTKLKSVTSYDEATLTGVVTSHCRAAAGVQLKWTAYNSDGTVAFSNDFWPASTTNIAPQSDYAFQMMNASPRGRWSYTVTPISVNTW